MRTKYGNCLALVGVVGVGLLAWEPAHASLARNAAGAKNIGSAGNLSIDMAGEIVTEPDGKAWVVVADVQYQVTDRLQFLVEAAVFELLQPDTGEDASGLGDTDVTLSWLAGGQRDYLPSVVLGAKAKLPTAQDEEIGTGKPDYSALFILGSEIGELELSLETEYAKFGQAGDERLKDQFIYSFTAEYSLNDYLAVYAEAFGNSAPTPRESRTDAALAGLEVDIPVSERIAPYLSFEADTEGVIGGRAGIEWTW